MSGESSDENDDCPQLVDCTEKRIPVTIITGFLGNQIGFLPADTVVMVF